MKKHFYTLGLCLLSLIRVTAQPGTIDLTFGEEGITHAQYEDKTTIIFDLLGDADTNTLCVGYCYDTYSFRSCYLVKFLENGSLDPDFGDGGKVLTSISPEDDEFNALVQMDNGDIVAAGRAWFDGRFQVVVARYTSAGILISTFGNNGYVLLDLGEGNFDVGDMVLGVDDKLMIVVTHYPITKSLSGSTPYIVAGTLEAHDLYLDQYFGNNGIKKINTSNENDNASGNSIKLTNDEKIVVSGNFSTTLGEQGILLAKILSNGEDDLSFGKNGVATYIGTNPLWESGLALDIINIDCPIKVTATAWNGTDYDINVIGYTSDGYLYPSYGQSGIAVSDIGDEDAYDMVIDYYDDGYLTITGTLFSPDFGNNREQTSSLLLVRFNPDGSIDESFGDNGITITPLGSSGYAYSYAATLQCDGKILQGGTDNTEGSYRMTLARYLNDVTTNIETERVNQSVINLYPNPTTGIINLQASNGEHLSSIEVYNTYGKLIYKTDNIGATILTINLGEFPSGIYYVKSNNEKFQAQKILLD